MVEAKKNGLVGSPVLAPVQISMVTRSAWTPLGADRPVVVRVTGFCRMECVWPGRSVAANIITALLMVRSTICNIKSVYIVLVNCVKLSRDYLIDMFLSLI